LTLDTIPYDKQLERAVLSACFYSPETVIKQVIAADSGIFYNTRYNAIFKAMEEIFENGNPVTSISVIEKAKEKGLLEKIGGESSIMAIEEEAFTSATSAYHIELLIVYLVRRKLHNMANTTLAACNDNKADIGDIIENIYTQLSDIKTLAMGNRETLVERIRKWIGETEGTFKGTDIDIELSLGTKKDKANRKKILQRFCKNDIIERTGKIQNCFRVIENQCDNIEWQEAKPIPFDINIPLGIDGFAKVFPGNLIVVAGEANAGKTAFLLNLAGMNIRKHKVYYFSSEMGAEEFKIRIDEFDNKENFLNNNFMAKERSGNFSDVIRPNDINIVDFLECHDEFYKIGGWLKKITDKLNNGVAIVAIQKNPGSGYGLGGARSIERARLYISMEPGKIIIKKVKIYRHKDINPNGFELEFKLACGCKFIPDDAGWHKGEN